MRFCGRLAVCIKAVATIRCPVSCVMYPVSCFQFASACCSISCQTSVPTQRTLLAERARLEWHRQWLVPSAANDSPDTAVFAFTARDRATTDSTSRPPQFSTSVELLRPCVLLETPARKEETT